MEYTTLGGTGMKISRIGLGCMSFGSDDWRDWILTEAESRKIINRAIELGINFFDTANMYSNGESERILGDVLAEYDRDRLVVADKVWGDMDETNPNASGLSRKAIQQELNNSLERLGMDKIDLYQTHRWDYDTPIEETLRTLDDAVHRGKVRYIGTSSQYAYQFAETLHISEQIGVEQYVSMQNHYNLVYREEEREMIPLCERNGIGTIPWSPLARGYLARPHRKFTESTRAEYMNKENSHLEERVENYIANGGKEINERVEELAENKDITMAQLSLAWLLHQNVVDAPIIGTTSVEHLEEAVEAIQISLSEDELAYLQEPYEPTSVNGPI